MMYRNRRKSRRGVLLLVVLVLLVMFLLAGMTFIIVAGAYKKDTTMIARHEQNNVPIEDLFEESITSLLAGPVDRNGLGFARQRNLTANSNPLKNRSSQSVVSSSQSLQWFMKIIS